MTIDIYSRAIGPWLLVPACLLPSHAASLAFGPLTYAGSASATKLSLGKHLAALAVCDAFSFAEISPDDAMVLLRSESIDPKRDRYVSRIGPRSEVRLFAAALSAAEYEGWPSQAQVERA